MLSIVSLTFSQDLEQITESIWNRIGGKNIYHAAKQLSFSFVVEREGEIRSERHHLWNRQSGDYVFEQIDKEGHKIQVYYNINTKTGAVIKNGKYVTEEEGNKHIEQAYARYINDTYWLLVPAKLTDPGVRLKIDTGRSAEFDGTVLHLSFDNVGLTPGDQYWLYIDKNGSITEWHYILESGHQSEYLWQDETDCGAGLRFSTRKIKKNGDLAIVLKNVHFSKKVEQERFELPYVVKN
jgi:hypothetical protein